VGAVPDPLIQIITGAPRVQLRPVVAGYSGYRVDCAEPGIHRGLPSRYLTIIVTLSGTVDLSALPDPALPPASFTTLAGGLHARPALISHDGRQHGIQLHLTPLGARVLLGLPAGELAHTVLDLGTLLGASADELRERLRSARTWTERFAQLDGVLARLASSGGRLAPPPAELGWAWQRLTASHGRVAISALARQVGWSRRHLSARFHREFGLTPKIAGRVMRFEVAHRLLRAPRRPGLAEVAARCGYADQAHFSREWRELAGCSPSRWLAEEIPYVQDNPEPQQPP
jgi:AraC-like DNA-binding protein